MLMFQKTIQKKKIKIMYVEKIKREWVNRYQQNKNSNKSIETSGRLLNSIYIHVHNMLRYICLLMNVGCSVCFLFFLTKYVEIYGVIVSIYYFHLYFLFLLFWSSCYFQFSMLFLGYQEQEVKKIIGKRRIHRVFLRIFFFFFFFLQTNKTDVC